MSRRYILARKRLDVRRKYIDTIGELNSSSIGDLNGGIYGTTGSGSAVTGFAGDGIIGMASGIDGVLNGIGSSMDDGGNNGDGVNAENGSMLSTWEAEETGTSAGILPLTLSAEVAEKGSALPVDSGSHNKSPSSLEGPEHRATSPRQASKTKAGSRSSSNSISSLMSRIPVLSPSVSSADRFRTDSDDTDLGLKRSHSANIDHNRSIINSYSSSSSRSSSNSAYGFMTSQIPKPASGGHSSSRERANVFKGTCAEHPDQNLRGNGRGYCVRCASDGVRVKRPRSGGKARSAADGIDGDADGKYSDDDLPGEMTMRDSNEGEDEEDAVSADEGAAPLVMNKGKIQGCKKASKLSGDDAAATRAQPADALLLLSSLSSNQSQMEKLTSRNNANDKNGNGIDADGSSDSRRRCESCHKKHDGLFGSGRFCDISCRAKFAAAQPANPNNRYMHSKGDKQGSDGTSSTGAAGREAGTVGNGGSANGSKSGSAKKPRNASTGSTKKKGTAAAPKKVSKVRVRWGKEKIRPFAAVQWSIEFAQICNMNSDTFNTSSSSRGNTSSVAGNAHHHSNSSNSSNSNNSNNTSGNHSNPYLPSMPLPPSSSSSSSSSSTLPYVGGAGGFPGVVSIPCRKLIASSSTGTHAAALEGTGAASLARSTSNGSNHHGSAGNGVSSGAGGSNASGIVGGEYGDPRMIAPYFVQQVLCWCKLMTKARNIVTSQ